jgi:3-hydroxyisobutyrate dehydrogenase
MIAFFGTGLLGANFVRAFLRRGEHVHVWNRTPERASALVPEGAVAFSDPAEAARGAARIHLSLSDDAAVDGVLERARPGIATGAGVTIVDHTTTSPTETAARAARWHARGVGFQHAPVFMGPPNALEGTGTMLASGDRAQYDALSPELAKMTGRIVYVGPEPDRAAGMKLLGNLFLMALTSGLADVFSLGKALGIGPDDVASLFQFFNPGAALEARLKRMRSADYRASWELSMARKDARLMLDEARSAGVLLAVLPAIAAEMDRWIEKGHGRNDWTVIAKDAVTPGRD